MKLIRVLFGAIPLVLIVAACGSSSPGAGAPPNDYLATGNGWVNYLQWDSTGTGTFTNEQLTGTAPDETVQNNQNPITVAIKGSQVDFTGLSVQTGTLSDGTLSLQVLNSDGTLGSDTFTPAGADAFNKAVGALQSVASTANSGALAQQAQASAASANAAAESQAQSDLATLQGAYNFSSDLNALSGDVSQTNTDLATTQSDAAQGANAGGGDCINLEGIVNPDVEGSVVPDVQGGLVPDLSTLTNDIGSAQSDISTLQNDLATLKSDGLPSPPGASAAITATNQAIAAAVSQANSDIATANSDVNQAYAAGNAIATGACSGDGPGSPPTPVSPVS